MSRRRHPAASRAERRTNGSLRQEPGVNYRRAGFAAAAVLILVAALAAVVTTRGAAAHPTPRAGITGEQVMHHSHFTAYPRVQAVYNQAARVPEVLDGLHCYCYCGAHSGHYSLLDCFKTDHGAGCDICLTSAALAYALHKQGKTLDEIRTAVDEVFAR